jgi:hypothetical protein
VQQDVLNEAVAAKLLEVIGRYELTEKRLIEGDDHSATLKKLGTQIADLTTQHYVHNGVPDFHKRMQELEAEHARVSALPRGEAEGAQDRDRQALPAALGGHG